MTDTYEKLCVFLESEKTEDDCEAFEDTSLIYIDWKEEPEEICGLILPEEGIFRYTSEDIEDEYQQITIYKDNVSFPIPFQKDCYYQWEVLKKLDEVLRPEYVLMQYARYRGADGWGLICLVNEEYDLLKERYGSVLYEQFIPGIYDNVKDYEEKQYELIHGKRPAENIQTGNGKKGILGKIKDILHLS